MNIEFIKWLVGYAEGFESLNNNDGSLNGIHYRHIYAFGDIQKSAVYPLLLQRAIEGLGIQISASSVYIEMGDPDDPFYGKCVSEFKNIDEAKEAALKYIWENTAWLHSHRLLN